MNEIATFKYETLDVSTADFLRKKESNMREIVGKAYTDLGRELKEAQDTLAKKGYGCFEEWYRSFGFKRQNVYRLIERYENLILPKWEERDFIESLPVTLTYEIAKPSAESTPAKAQAKAEVLNGDIDTLKAYRERIAELKAQADEATDKAEQAESARQIAEAKAQRYEQVFGDAGQYGGNATKVTNGDATLLCVKIAGYLPDFRGKSYQRLCAI